MICILSVHCFLYVIYHWLYVLYHHTLSWFNWWCCRRTFVSGTRRHSTLWRFLVWIAASQLESAASPSQHRSLLTADLSLAFTL